MFKAVLAACLLVACTVSANAQDDAHGVREFTGSAAWRVPAGVTRITFELWGGGGGGAGGGSAAVGGGPGGGGGGGGAGAYVRTSVGVKAGDTYTIAVGAAGVGGLGDAREAAQPGGDGGDTSIVLNGSVLLTARGGRGGQAPKRGDIKGGAGGSGGPAQATATSVVRPGLAGAAGQTGGFSEWTSTSGGHGGAAVLGTLQPPGAFGGAGGNGMHFGSSEAGKPGGAGSAVVTW